MTLFLLHLFLIIHPIYHRIFSLSIPQIRGRGRPLIPLALVLCIYTFVKFNFSRDDNGRLANFSGEDRISGSGASPGAGRSSFLSPSVIAWFILNYFISWVCFFFSFSFFRVILSFVSFVFFFSCIILMSVFTRVISCLVSFCYFVWLFLV